MKFTNRRIANTILISTLLVASIASIGFSSWLIGNSDNDNKANINIDIGKIDSSASKYISKLNSTLDTSVSYCSEGFVSSGKIVTKTLILDTYFYFKPDLYYDVTNYSINPIFTFSFDFSNFIGDVILLNSVSFNYSTVIYQTLDANDLYFIDSSIYNKDNYLSKYQSSNIPFYFSMSFSYNGSSFSTEVYPSLKNSSISINISIGATI